MTRKITYKWKEKKNDEISTKILISVDDAYEDK